MKSFDLAILLAEEFKRLAECPGEYERLEEMLDDELRDVNMGL
jgi:hypothetical protein